MPARLFIRFAARKKRRDYGERIVGSLLCYGKGDVYMTKKLHSIADVGRLLDVQEYRIEYAHRTGKVPDVERVGGKRIYREADLRRIAKHFDIDLNEVAK